jgi:hypothetical protein
MLKALLASVIPAFDMLAMRDQEKL